MYDYIVSTFDEDNIFLLERVHERYKETLKFNIKMNVIIQEVLTSYMHIQFEYFLNPFNFLGITYKINRFQFAFDT